MRVLSVTNHSETDACMCTKLEILNANQTKKTKNKWIHSKRKIYNILIIFLFFFFSSLCRWLVKIGSTHIHKYRIRSHVIREFWIFRSVFMWYLFIFDIINIDVQNNFHSFKKFHRSPVVVAVTIISLRRKSGTHSKWTNQKNCATKTRFGCFV